jgi:hypothetical protein
MPKPSKPIKFLVNNPRPYKMMAFARKHHSQNLKFVIVLIFFVDFNCHFITSPGRIIRCHLQGTVYFTCRDSHYIYFFWEISFSNVILYKLAPPRVQGLIFYKGDIKSRFLWRIFQGRFRRWIIPLCCSSQPELWSTGQFLWSNGCTLWWTNIAIENCHRNSGFSH